MSLAFLFHYLILNMFRMLIHPSSGACDLFVELFHGLYCSGSMCVGVMLWFGWGGVLSECRHTDNTQPQPKHRFSLQITESTVFIGKTNQLMLYRETIRSAIVR